MNTPVRTTSVSYTQPYRPGLIAGINHVGRMFGADRAPIDGEALIRAAARKTRLDDFGDGSFRLTSGESRTPTPGGDRSSTGSLPMPSRT